MVAIFVLLTIMLCITIEVVRSHMRVPAAVPGLGLAGAPTPQRWQVSLPVGLFLHPGHTWAEVAASGRVRVGLDDLLGRAIGQPEQLRLRRPGERVAQGEPMMAVVCNGRELTLPAPVSGVIEMANERVLAEPAALGREPYEGGWIYEVKPSRLGFEIGNLAVAEVAWVWLRQQFQEFGEWLSELGSARAGLAMQDGGDPAPGALAHVDAAAFAEFRRRFVEGVQVAAPGKQAAEPVPAWAAVASTAGE